MTESERVFDALRNCVTIPKCRDCPWTECEIFNHETVEIPKDLVLAVLRELADARIGRLWRRMSKCPNCGAVMDEEGEKNMTLNEYQKLAARTINNDLKPKDQVQHALFGLAAETGEILELYQKRYQGHILTVDRVIDEGGDALWMLAELFTALGVSFEEVAQHNVDKLKQRYPEGFDPDKSLHRGGENDNG